MSDVALVVDGTVPAPGGDVSVQVTADGNPRAGATVSVVHRPGLVGEHEVAIGVTDTLGRVRWKPVESGVATLETDGATLQVTVPWSAAPADTIVVSALLLVAAIVAIAYGLRRPRRFDPRDVTGV